MKNQNEMLFQNENADTAWSFRKGTTQDRIDELSSYKPSYIESAGMRFAASATSGMRALGNVDAVLEHTADNKVSDLNRFSELVEQLNSNPDISTPQHFVNAVAGLLGYMVDPITGGLGLGASLATKGITTFSKAIIPKYFAEKEIAGVTADVIAEKATHAFGVGSAVGLPESINQNYDQKRNTLDVLGTLKDVGEMGIFGIAIEAIPFSYGILKRRKAKQKLLESTEPEGVAAVEEALNEEEVNAVHQEISKSYKKTGDDKVVIPFLDENEMQLMGKVLSDQGISGLPKEQMEILSDFVMKKGLSKLIGNEEVVAGIKHVSESLAKKIETLSEVKTHALDNFTSITKSKTTEEIEGVKNKLFRKDGSLRKDFQSKPSFKKLLKENPERAEELVKSFNVQHELEKQVALKHYLDTIVNAAEKGVDVTPSIDNVKNYFRYRTSSGTTDISALDAKIESKPEEMSFQQSENKQSTEVLKAEDIEVSTEDKESLKEHQRILMKIKKLPSFEKISESLIDCILKGEA